MNSAHGMRGGGTLFVDPLWDGSRKDGNLCIFSIELVIIVAARWLGRGNTTRGPSIRILILEFRCHFSAILQISRDKLVVSG